MHVAPPPFPPPPPGWTVHYVSECRTLLASLLLCGAATSTLVWAPSSQTVLLFLGRAAVMASYTTLYVYTPEVGSAGLERLNIVQAQAFG